MCESSYKFHVYAEQVRNIRRCHTTLSILKESGVRHDYYYDTGCLPTLVDPGKTKFSVNCVALIKAKIILNSSPHCLRLPQVATENIIVKEFLRLDGEVFLLCFACQKEHQLAQNSATASKLVVCKYVRKAIWVQQQNCCVYYAIYLTLTF